MQDSLEKRMKSFLPYLIVIGIVFLIVPAMLLIGSDAIRYIVLIGLLPLTALLCCAHYSTTRKNDIMLSLAAPICFFVSMLLYRLIISDPLRSFIYLIAYFLCGYLGLTIGDILANRKSGDSRSAAARPSTRAPRRDSTADVQEAPARRSAPSQRPARVPVERESEQPVRRSAPSQRPAGVPVEREPEQPVRRPAPSQRAARVPVENIDRPATFASSDPYDDRSLDLSTTSDDIDAILREIHQRRGND